MLFDRIVLTCCMQFRSGRSVSAIFHLLKGKRSIQTVQDAHIYKLSNYYGIYKSLRKQDFDERIQELVSKNLLLLEDDYTASPTASGFKFTGNEKNITINYFNGMKYYQSTQVFFERLKLLLQTITNSANSNLRFIPIVDKPAITDWVKKYYLNVRQRQTRFLYQIHDELYELLSCLSEQEASIFVDCITGFQHYGMSTSQLSVKYNIDKIDVPLVLTAIIQRMLQIMEYEKEKYPLLSAICDDMSEDSKLTHSAKKTNEFLNRNYTAEQIASARRLKLNTIYDHLVEIALYDKEFPLKMYINEVQRQEILSAVKKLNSYKLKEIKQEIDDTISYFQIRLVLACENIHN